MNDIVETTVEPYNTTVGGTVVQPVIWWPALFLFILVIAGVFGNILVCLAICLNRRLQNATNFFLLSLAVADLFVSLLVMPMAILQLFLGSWPFNSTLCNVWVTFDVLCCSSSIYHMVFISVGRYIGIRNPLMARQARLIVSRRGVMYKIALAWILSAVVSCPISILAITDISYIQPEEGACNINSKNFQVFGSFAVFFLPMILMMNTYVATVSLLKERAKFCSDATSMEMAKESPPVPSRSSSNVTESKLGSGTSRGKKSSKSGWRKRARRSEVQGDPDLVVPVELDEGDHPVQLNSCLKREGGSSSHREEATMRFATESSIPSSMSSSTEKDKTGHGCDGDDGKEETQHPEWKQINDLNPNGGDQNSICNQIDVDVKVSSTSRSTSKGITKGSINGANIADETSNRGTNNNNKNSHRDERSPSSSSHEHGHAHVEPDVRISKSHGNGSGQVDQSKGQAEDPDMTITAEGNSKKKGKGRKKKKRNRKGSPQLSPPDAPQGAPQPSTTSGTTDHRPEQRLMIRTHSTYQVRTEQKATKVLGLVFFVFCICWSPFFTVNLITGFLPSFHMPESLLNIFLWLGYGSSIVNPAIYTIFNKNFRTTFKDILLCRFNRKQTPFLYGHGRQVGNRSEFSGFESIQITSQN